MRKLIFIAFVIVGLALCLYFFMFHGSLSDNSEEFSRFGDYIGGTIGATMAMLSAYLVFITYRKQIEFTTQQMTISRRSQFEHNFFQLLQFQRDIAKTLVIKRRDTMRPTKILSYIGDDAFSHAAEDIKQAMLELAYMTQDIEGMGFGPLRRKLDGIFSQTIANYGEQSLSHYYRHLYNVLKFVVNSEFEDKENYISIVQSQMTNDELYLLFFDALSKYGYPKLYNIISRYSMLENLHYNDFDYFKLLQRKCYPHTYFKHSPNNAILIAGFFNKPREATIYKLSKQFEACLIDIESINYRHNDDIKLKIIGGSNLIVKHLSDVLHSDTLYFFDSSFVKSNLEPIENSIFQELNPKAVVLCADDVTSIRMEYANLYHIFYEEKYIKNIIETEKKAALEFAENYNIPLAILKSNDQRSMSDFISEQG